jgi:diaminopimelate decarboxylase
MKNNRSPLAPDWLELPENINQISGKIWPTNLQRSQNGDVVIGGVSVGELAAQYGTPLMVIDQDDFFARGNKVKTAFESASKKIGTSCKIYYAGKSLLTTEIVSWVNKLGLNLDVSTGGELALALAGGIDPARIGLHGNNKSLYEIGRAVTANVGAIVIDSEIEVERIASVAGARARFSRFEFE